MTYKEIVAKVSEELGLPKSLVNRIYKAYWKAIRENIKALPLKEDLTEEEFRSMKTSFNITRLGKLFVPRDGYLKRKKGWKRYKEKHDKTKEN